MVSDANIKKVPSAAIQQAHDFTATVAHELRTPLHTAAGFLSFLLQDMAGPLTVMQRNMLASVATSLEQAQMLTEDLLCLAALEQGQLSLDLAPLDLRSVVQTELNQLRLMADAANVKLDGLNLTGDECKVKAARNRLGQCLRNLIVNAIKFSPIGGTVRVAIEQHSDAYIVSIEDNGPGISPENLDRIFERRFQAKEGVAHHLAGYGLGLSITKDLVERQGGKLGVESQIGQGSRFWFSLPRTDGEGMKDEG